MTYIFKYKRQGFFNTTKSVKVTGHKFLPDQNKMVLFKEDGGLEEIVEWSKCSVTLSTDWVNVTKQRMEKDAGTSIPLNVKG